MIDYFLKFTDEAEAKTVLSNYVDEEGNWLSRYNGQDIDPYGVEYKSYEDGSLELQTGFHVNMRSRYDLEDTLNSYRVYPSTPSHTWAD